MKFINSLLVIAAIVTWTLVLTLKVSAAPTDETEAEVETEAETESETEKPYSDDDFYELSHVIQAEAGYTYWEMMIGVGSVVLNRVKSDKFPNTVYEVIHQESPTIQYSTVSYLSSQVPTEMVLEATDFLLRNGSQYPENVLYQANFPQGTGTHEILSTSYSTMYFCYG